MHGGSAPQVKAKAAGRVREQQAAAAAAAFGLPIEIDPAQALLEEVHRTAGMVAWLGAQVERVTGDTPDNLIRGIRSTKRTTGRSKTGAQVDMTATEAGPGVHEWLVLWRSERAHLVQACRAALSAGVEQRMVDAVERQAEQFGVMVAGIADDLGLQGPEREALFVKAQRRFTLVQGGAVA